MTPQPLDLDIIEFAMSRKYLGKQYLSPAQVSILKAIYGLEMTREERIAFLELTEGRPPRKGGYQEAAIICGVRSGKTELGATVLTFECIRWLHCLQDLMPPGKTAKGIIIAQNEKGARESREYVEGHLSTLEEKFPGRILAPVSGQERAITGRAIRLAGACEIVIYPSKKAAVRGSTGLCFIGDEVAFWEAAEGAFDQDEKVMKAVRSRFATLSKLKPKRLLISSPDEEEGVLFEAWKARNDNPRRLVVNAPSWKLNPAIDQDFLDLEQADDPEGFVSEYGAKFKSAGGAHCFLPKPTILGCIDKGVLRRPPKVGVEYVAWMDAAFKRDRFSFGIGHAEQGPEKMKVVIDFMRHWTPPPISKRRKQHRPLDDRNVIEAIVQEMRPYGIDRIHGDQFADIPLKNTFKTHGIVFVESPVTTPEKFEAFKNLRAVLQGKLCRLPDDPILIKDLGSLQRKKTPGGHVSIAAPNRKGSYDDAANVVARIIMKLLPLSSGFDTREMNRHAMDSSNRRKLDWRDPDSTSPGGVGNLGSVDLGEAFGDVWGAVL